VALGVFVVLQVVLGGALLEVVIWPVWLLIIELLWLFALWLYYFVRFMTRQRSGPGDPETQRRGAALDGTISRMEQERRGGGAGAAGGGSAAPR
jgi:membrane protein implicated in regulation of membrane protease activity